MPNYTTRKKLPAKKKVGAVMREFKAKKLHSGKRGPGKGKLVKSRKQAIAIGLSEARKAGAKIPKKKVFIHKGKKT